MRSLREVSGAGWCFELMNGAATSRGGMGLYNVGCRRIERSICGLAGDVDRTDGDRGVCMVAGESRVGCAWISGDLGRSVLMADVGGLFWITSARGGIGASSMSSGPLVERL